MAMIKFEISPFDVLFFGDGRPFNMGGVARSMALPMPHTIAGAITSKLKAMKVDGDLNRSVSAIYGPFLQRGNNLYLPKPANVLKQRKGKIWKSVSVPTAGFNLIGVENTNIRDVKVLPFYIGKDRVEGGYGFISLESLREFIKNGMAFNSHMDVQGIDQFVLDEPRVGISISKDGTVGEDGLYRAWFKRPKDDVKLVVWVKFKEDLKKHIMKAISETGVLKLGGESRVAHYVRRGDSFLNLFKGFPKCGKGKVKCNLMFLTPGVLGDWNPFGPVYSASVSGYINVPINLSDHPLRHTVERAIPPGSIFWGVELNLPEETNVGFLNRNDGDLQMVQGFKDFTPFIGSNLALIWPYQDEKKEGKDAK